MNINWRLKIIMEKGLSVVPGGYTLAQWLREKISDMDFDMSKRILKGLDNFKLLTEKTGKPIRGAQALEFGTGMTLVDPLILYFLGAERVYTFDHIIHVSEPAFRAALTQMPHQFPVMVRHFDVTEAELNERYERIARSRTLSEICDEVGITLLNYPVESSKIEVGTIDIFFSESVLQRFPEDRLQAEMRSVSKLLGSGSVSFHRIDCKDINSQAAYYDRTLWPLYYLKYSDWFWNLMTSRKFNSQNRWRWNQFIDLLELFGLGTMYTESIAHEEDIERLRTFRVARRFSNFEIEDLSVQCCKLISGKEWKGEADFQAHADRWKHWIDI